ncbi:hypothetical protein GQ600_12263 [Phytophthora cactorum]|nr:hypothetical protein GQ600_12263 [Phytophthora cactorum]
MSTLTSAELHVKRSSTRLHAPPGGASSLSFGCGGLGTAEPAKQSPNKDDPAYSRPTSSDRYAPPTSSRSNNNSNAPGATVTTTGSKAAVLRLPRQVLVRVLVLVLARAPGALNLLSRPRSGTTTGRKSDDCGWRAKTAAMAATMATGHPLLFNLESWPCWGVLDDSINPPSPLSKFMHQHAQQQQQQQPPPTPDVGYQRLGTANSTRSSTSSYMNHQPNPTPIQMRGAGYPPAGASLSRAGLSTHPRPPRQLLQAADSHREANASGRWGENYTLSRRTRFTGSRAITSSVARGKYRPRQALIRFSCSACIHC